MPWGTVKLNDGTSIPGIGFGTGRIPKELTADRVEQAISVGLIHVDTSPVYCNEEQVGKAIRGSGLNRSEIYITTKYAAFDPDNSRVDVLTSVNNSLKRLGVSYIDLYLIHHYQAAIPDIPTVWRQMEEVQAKGLVRSIGVSNFEVHHLEILLASAKVLPVVNQIELHPYAYARQKPILDYAAEHNIVIGSYYPLFSIIKRPGGPLDKPLKTIASRLQATDDQVLLAWAKAKGAVVNTTSSKKNRLEGYVTAGDLELEYGDVAALDEAGR
ncbi:hypothetical protein APHAL10511_000480 [Amanita phalloides]|nr:hypothetical protein APHAL10511_000480 [Amanita phalloides]